jgi:hypothetical protein
MKAFTRLKGSIHLMGEWCRMGDDIKGCYVYIMTVIE